jgi:peptidoglycan/xylan/chitin deacetylase (PgdA/CDA1 family)
MKTMYDILFWAALLMVGGSGFARTIDAPYEVGTWPGFRQAAVSYTFDDSCANQFAIALPMFNEFGFKMTLFTATNWPTAPNWPVLQDVAARGHEIASHSVTHSSLSGLTLTNQTAELKNSRDDINAHITGQKCLTLAYPYCVPSDLGLTQQYYIAARHCQGAIEPSTPKDFYQISSIICGSSGSLKAAANFSSKFDSTAVSRGWCVLLIHGIDNDGGYSPLPSTVLRASLEYLAARPDTFWVATFLDAVRYIRERNDVSVKESSSQDDSITLQVTDTLDNAIYSYPVTLRRPLPADWPGAKVSQNSRTVAASVVTVNSVNYMMFDVVPDAGDVVLSKCPATPAGLTAAPGYATVMLDWNDNSESNLAGYHVYRSTTSGSGYGRLTSSLLTRSSYDDANVPHNADYYYVVTAADQDSRESGYSNEVRGGLYGDWSGNGTVRMDDLSFLLRSWLVDDCNGTFGVDLNEDCAVNLYEFDVLAENWGQAPPNTGATTSNRPRSR